MSDIERDALIQRLSDAFEDAGLYSPDRDMVEGVYEDAVEPLRRQLAGAVGALRDLASANPTIASALWYADTAAEALADAEGSRR